MRLLCNDVGIALRHSESSVSVVIGYPFDQYYSCSYRYMSEFIEDDQIANCDRQNECDCSGSHCSCESEPLSALDKRRRYQRKKRPEQQRVRSDPTTESQ